MIILGISGGHDANWCVVRDGELLGAFEKERFTRKRHDSGEVFSLIGKSLAFLGISPLDIDVVATSEPVFKDEGSGLQKLAGKKYQQPDKWEPHVVRCFDRVLPCISVPHHLAHAAYAYFSSGFTDAAVITWDGGGDFYTEEAYATTTISSWKGSQLEWLERVANSDFGSLWYIYSQAIFGEGENAGKLMGLSALGSDRMVKAMADRYVIPLRETLYCHWGIKPCWPDEDRPAFLRQQCTWRDAIAQDLAFAIQYLTTQTGLNIAQGVRKQLGHAHLALSGGVALNGYLNTAIRKYAGFEQVFVPPSVHDGGLSVGCAFFASAHVFNVPIQTPPMASLAFTGMSYEDELDQAFLSSSFLSKRVGENELEMVAAEAIAQGKVVAWYNGRSEHGPRALGNRSILCAATDESMTQRLNTRIKFREEFRPVAPVVLEDRASEYFHIDWSSPYMMYIVEATEKGKKSIPAALHNDGTARVQTVDTSSSLGRITDYVGKLTGTPVVINTSFNVRTPIVETPLDALDTFSRVPIDLLCIGRRLVTKT